jgi:phosphoserine phosphatase
LNQMSVQPRMKVAPKEIESIAATHKTSSGRTIAIVSGGVSVDVNSIAERLSVDTTETNRVSVERSLGELPPVTASRFWR